MEGPEFSLQGTFYPYGFPLGVRTNSAEMMVLMEETWVSLKSVSTMCRSARMSGCDCWHCHGCTYDNNSLPLVARPREPSYGCTASGA